MSHGHSSQSFDTGESRWLVKSANRVLGPFSFEEIVQLLMEHKLFLYDEVKDPLGRWQVFTQREEFQRVIETLKAQTAELTEDITVPISSETVSSIVIVDAGGSVGSSSKIPPQQSFPSPPLPQEPPPLQAPSSPQVEPQASQQLSDVSPPPSGQGLPGHQPQPSQQPVLPSIQLQQPPLPSLQPQSLSQSSQFPLQPLPSPIPSLSTPPVFQKEKETKVFGYEHDRRFKNILKSSSTSYSWVFFILGLFLVGYFLISSGGRRDFWNGRGGISIFSWHFGGGLSGEGTNGGGTNSGSGGGVSGSSVKILPSQSLALLRMGNYPKAFEQITRFNYFVDLRPQERWELLPLLIAYNRTADAKLILQKMGDPGRNQRFPSEKNFLLALIDLREGRYSEAESVFKKMTSSPVIHQAATVNLVISHFFQKQWDLVVSELDNIRLRDQGLPPVLLLLEGFLSLDPGFSRKHPEYVKQAYQEIDHFSSQFPLYRKEMGILGTALSNAMGKMDPVEKNIESLLDQFPFPSTFYGTNLYTDHQLLNWREYRNLCDRIVNEKKDLPFIAALDSYCSYVSGEVFQSVDKIEKMRAQYSDQSRFNGWYAFIQDQMDMPEKTKALLLALDVKKFKVGRGVEAQVCFRKGDFNCSQSLWKQVLELDPLELRAYLGLAESQMQLSDLSGARATVQNGLALAPQFVPLIELQFELNTSPGGGGTGSN